jgi:hypothetical protein
MVVRAEVVSVAPAELASLSVGMAAGYSVLSNVLWFRPREFLLHLHQVLFPKGMAQL